MTTVAEFLIERLENVGVKHIFGVAGDYVLQFIHQISNSKKLKFIKFIKL